MGLGFWPWVLDIILVCPSMLLVVQKYMIPSHTITIFVLCFSRFFYIVDTTSKMNQRSGANPSVR